MRLSDITVEVRDKSLARIGLVRPEELDMELSGLHNSVGAWKLKLAAEHPLMGALRQPGSGIIVTGPNDVMFSGPTVKPENQATATDPAGTVTVEGVDDTVLLADALAYPQPSNANPETQTTAHDIRTGAVETLMHAFVNANIGPGAPAGRRPSGLLVSMLTMGANLGRGPTTTKSVRFASLGNLLAELAATANLGVRIVQRGNVLVFETSEVVDRSREIRLDIRNNTLAGHRVATSPPATTRALVGGQNEGAKRQFVSVTTPESLAGEADWGRRIEAFVDQRNTDKLDELKQAGLERLADDGAATLAVQVVPMEDSGMDFGIHWNAGDKVGVVVEDQELATTVTGYIMKVNKDGFRLGAVLGDPSGFDPDAALAKRVASTESRVSALERNAELDSTLGPRLDKLEGATETLERTSSLAPGAWYRIGIIENAQDGAPAKASAVFDITTNGSGVHAHLRIRASYAYSDRDACSVNLEEYGGYNSSAANTPPFTGVRLRPLGGTYDNAAIEVLCAVWPSNGSLTMRVEHSDWRGGQRWTPVNFESQGTADIEWINRGMWWLSRWQALSLLNGWVNYTGGYPFAEFRMHPGSLVEVRGLVRNGAGDIAQLPAGCRPRYRLLFPSIGGGNAIARVDVTNVGLLSYQAGSTGFITLDTIRFSAEW